MTKEEMSKRDPFHRLLKNKNFLKLWLSQVLSQVTINLAIFVIVLRIFSLTNSTTAVVGKTQLAAANTFFISTAYGARLVGFSLAGLLMKFGGHNFHFIIGSIFLAIATLMVTDLPAMGRRKPLRLTNLGIFFQQMKEGYLFTQSRLGVLFPLVMLAITSITLSVVTFLLPSYATRVLAIDLLDVGLFLIIPAGIGALIGARLVVSLVRRKRKKAIIKSGLVIASLSLLFLGAINPLLSQGRVIMGIVFSLFLGASYPALIIPSQTLIQEQTPRKLRGRVFGALGFLITLAALLPVIITATMADVVGVTFVITLLGASLGFLAYYVSQKEPYEAFLAANYRSRDSY